MANVTRTYGGTEFTFGPMTVGFMKRNKEILKKAVAAQSRSLDDIEELTVVIYESIRRGSGESPEVIDDALGVDDAQNAVIASLEAIGFTFAKVESAGEEKPAEE